jgi:alkylresorcinol/alkylpyrone synthase
VAVKLVRIAVAINVASRPRAQLDCVLRWGLWLRGRRGVVSLRGRRRWNVARTNWTDHLTSAFLSSRTARYLTKIRRRNGRQFATAQALYRKMFFNLGFANHGASRARKMHSSKQHAMQIVSATSAYPRNYYPQEILADAFGRHWDAKLQHPEMLRWLHERVGVNGRYLAYPIETYENLKDFGEANDLWIEAATELGQQGICRALTHAGVSREDVGALFFVSITGIASPSIDARLINRMGLSPNIRRVPMFGLGCVAGAAGLSLASDYVRAYPNQVAVLLAVELCSLTIQRDDLSTANLISSSLFGDGAVAVILAGAERELPGPRIIGTRSVFYPDTEDVMGWNISEKGFRIVLSPGVPNMVRKHLARDVDTFLADFGLKRADVGAWIIHTGGPKVLEATQESLDLPRSALQVSWDCLRETGNLLSASVLAVLEKFLCVNHPAPGTWSVLAAMGPGFCSELVLLQW